MLVPPQKTLNSSHLHIARVRVLGTVPGLLLAHHAAASAGGGEIHRPGDVHAAVPVVVGVVLGVVHPAALVGAPEEAVVRGPVLEKNSCSKHHHYINNIVSTR